MAEPLDLNWVRRQFPALGGGTIFMDNAGGSQCLSAAADRITDFLLNSNVQTGASYAASLAATERVAAARASMAKLVNARDPSEIIMGTNSSTLMKFLAEAMAPAIQEGDEIIVTSADHASHISPFLALERFGAKIRWWRFDETSFELPLSGLENLLTRKTKLVAVTHTSNILGHVQDIKAIAHRVHDAGAELAADGVAFAPHKYADVQELGCDYYFLSLYKLFGPHQAIMYGRKECLLKLANIYQYFMGPERIPHKLEPGNCNYELAWGSTAIVDYLETLGSGELAQGYARIHAHEQNLTAQLLDGLKTFPKIRIIGPDNAEPATRLPTMSFVHAERQSQDIVEVADKAGIGIRYGDFYARDVVEQLGLPEKGGVVRVSLAHYNTSEEVDHLLETLAPVLR